MVWFQFMLLMMNDLFDIINAFIKDIEDASPNLKNNLNEIYPIKFKLNFFNTDEDIDYLIKTFKIISENIFIFFNFSNVKFQHVFTRKCV